MKNKKIQFLALLITINIISMVLSISVVALILNILVIIFWRDINNSCDKFWERDKKFDFNFPDDFAPHDQEVLKLYLKDQLSNKLSKDQDLYDIIKFSYIGSYYWAYKKVKSMSLKEQKQYLYYKNELIVECYDLKYDIKDDIGLFQYKENMNDVYYKVVCKIGNSQHQKILKNVKVLNVDIKSDGKLCYTDYNGINQIVDLENEIATTTTTKEEKI